MQNEPQHQISSTSPPEQPTTQPTREQFYSTQNNIKPPQTQSIIQKQQKIQSILTNQSNLLQSQIINNQIKNNFNSFDQQPIGGGKKIQFSEYPQEGDNYKPPVKKTITKKTTKKVIKEELSNNNQNVLMSTYSKSLNEDITISKNNTNPLDQLPVGGNNKNQFSEFDQKPISGGGKNAFNMSQFPDGQQQPVQQTEYPMIQKLKSKAVKLRLSGMEDLIKLLEEDPQNSDINEVDVKTMVKQTAPANLEKGLQVLKLWVQKGKRWGDDQIKNAIENGMAKNITKKKTIEICDLMYQQNPNTVQGSILLGMKGKLAKNIAYYITVIYQLLAIYGIKRMKYLKPYIGQIVKLLNDKKDVAIKTQCIIVLKEAYKWLGKDVISPMLGDLKENLKKQIDSFWETYDQSVVMKAPKGQESADDGDNKKKKKVDAYQLSEAVDVFKKFNQKWSEGVMNAAKWSQKTKMLQEFVKSASVPKLANTQYRHISEMIKRLINDSNFNVVIWDMKVLACLSRGLRRHFYPVVKNIFSQVLGKFRDKKTQMIEETFNTLSDFMYCISLEDVLEDIKEGLQDKAPNMKVNVLNWIAKYIQSKAEQKGQIPDKVLDALKSLFGFFEKLLNDGNVEVRDCMARNIFKMKMSTGDDFFASLQAKMNKNLVSKATIDTKSVKGKQSTKKQKSPQKQMTKTGSSFKKIETKKQQSMNKSQIVTKKQQKKPSQPQLKLQRFQQIQLDQCCTKLVESGFPEQQIKNIKAPGSKQRSNVFNILKNESFDLLTTFTVFKELFKDWKQVNLLMNKQLIAFIEQKADEIEKPELVILIPFMIEKIGDTKFSQPLYRAIEKICRKIPGVFIVGYFIEKIKAQDFKKPKINSDVCQCIAKIIQIVSASNIPLRQTILFANDCYKNQFAKKGGIELIKKIYSYIGDQIKIYLEADTYTSLQAQLKKTKMATEDEKKPKVQFSGQAKKNSKATVNLLENKPKVDITQDVLKHMPKMNDNGNWQNRKESAQAIMGLVNDNFGRVTIQCMGDLMNGLKLRINDPNKQLIKVFMQLAGVLFPVLNDKQLKVFTKMFIVAIADGLSDKMQANKKQATATLNKIGQVVGKQQLLAILAPYLESDKQSRIQIINIMLLNEEFLQKTDTKDFAKGITNCLCDKNKEIRNSAEKLFDKVYEKIGIEVFRNIAKNQKPAVMKDLNSIYDKYEKEKTSNFGSQSYISKASSPSKDIKEIKTSNMKPPTASAQKKSLQKNRNYTSTIQIEPQDVQSVTNHSRIKAQGQQNYLSATQSTYENQKPLTYVQGDQIFANLKILTQFRVQRQQKPSWRFDQIREQEEDSVKEQISLLIRSDIGKKMLSFNNKRVSDAALQLIRWCKDITYQNHFRQVYDLLIKWTLLRLWGGNPSEMFLVEIIPPLMSILQKRKLVMNDAEVDLIISVIREYFISSFMNDYKVSDSLHIVVKSLVSLSSGERVLRKILRQFSFELTAIHKHLKKQTNLLYRDGLNKLTKMHLMDFIGNQDMLEEASKIKQLRSDPQFVDILYKKFHESILNNFGFRNFVQQSNPSNFTQSSIISTSNNSNQQQTQNPGQFGSRRERSDSNQRVDKSSEKRPANNSRITVLNVTMTQPQNVNMMVSKSQVISNRSIPPVPINPQNINKMLETSPLPQKMQKSNPIVNEQSQIMRNKPIANNDLQNFQSIKGTNEFSMIYSQDIDLSIYPAPHPISPLGKHLSKLLPYNEQTIRFFTQLFSEHGQKIANQLTTHAKIIFASILKSVMIMLQNRNEQIPQRIVGQMNLLQQCIKCKYIIRNVDDLLYTGISFALKQLIYEDQHKSAIHENLVSRGIDFKIDQFSKVINGAMLRILQNGNSQQVTNTLIRIHNEYINSINKSMKTFCLIVKCTTRAAQSYAADMKIDGVMEFFILINQYFVLDPPEVSLQEFQLSTREKPKPEENFLNLIKSIILELGKVLNSDIWQVYEKAMQHAKYQDNYIAPYLQFLKIKPQQRRPENRSANNSRQNEQIKKISELLSKNKTYDTGILHLKKFCHENMPFNPVEYFTSLGYDQKFITMVMNSLEGKQRRTPRKDSNDDKNKSKSPINTSSQIQQQNITEKIKKLKQKFQQIQPNTPNVSQKHIPDVIESTRKQSQDGQTSKDERAAEIKRRIDEMKSRLNQNFDKPR